MREACKEEMVILGLFIQAFVYARESGLLPRFLFSWPLSLQHLNAPQVARGEIILFLCLCSPLTEYACLAY